MTNQQIIENTIINFHRINSNTYDIPNLNGAKLLTQAIEQHHLKQKKLNKGKLIKFFRDEQEVGFMKGMRPGSTTDEAFNLCKDKFKLEKHLDQFGLNTLKSELFSEDDYQKAFDFIKGNNNETFVVKPLNLQAGKGIQFDVDVNNFEASWKKCIETQKELSQNSPSCIIQPYIKGFDLRVIIIEGTYAGAMLRLPAHVVGDGNKTILELIGDKNDKRQRITYFKSKLIPTDHKAEAFLNKHDMDFNTVPREDEVVMLTHISNLTFGGESIDVTDVLSEKIKQLAIHATASVPGLHTAGIDIMTEDYAHGEGYIIEMNTNSNLTMHHMPYKGDARYPYDDFVYASLIKHKVAVGDGLTEDEAELFGEIEQFLKLKAYYAEKQKEMNASFLVKDTEVETDLTAGEDIMNTKLLEDVLNHVRGIQRNMHDLDISLDLLTILKDELQTLGIKYEPFVFKGKERLKIYDGAHVVKDYTKNFYQNNSMFGFKISNDKFLTEKYLKLAGIRAANSILLKESQLEEAKQHIDDSTKPYVVKPLALSNGIGVFTNVNLDNIERVWEACFQIQKKRKVKTPQVLVQEHIKGYEIRVIVTEGKALSATMRTPAYVIGDGEQTIEQLINGKNETREKNGFFASKLIKLSDQMKVFLNRQGLDLNTVLEANRLVILNPVSNLVNGGENIVITEYVQDDILKLAEAAVAAMPGIQTAGVDIMLNDLKDTNATILEVNKAPAFQLNYYPYVGERQHPLQYIFKSLILEDRILNDRLDYKTIEAEDIKLLSERYKALYEKQKSLEKIIENLSKE